MACFVLRFQIVFSKERRSEELTDVNIQSLTQLVDDSQFDRVIGAIDDVSNGRLGDAAFHIELILCHPAFLEELTEPHADGFI